MDIGKSYLKYFTALLIFGMNGIVASYIDLSSYEIVFIRTLIGSLFLIAVLVFTRTKVRLFENKKHTLYLFISGMAMGISWLFLYEAYRRTGVGFASLVYYCGPVFVMILSPLLFREKLTWSKAVRFFAVIAGMLCLNLQALSDGNTSLGIICGILSAIMFSVMLICNKKTGIVAGLENTTWQLLVAFLTVAVYVGVKQGFVMHIKPGSVLPILILGIFNTGIGCYFYFSSIGHLPIQTVAVCGYLEPLSAVLFSMLLLHERLAIVQVAGIVLIFAGTAFGELFHFYRSRVPVRL